VKYKNYIKCSTQTSGDKRISLQVLVEWRSQNYIFGAHSMAECPVYDSCRENIKCSIDNCFISRKLLYSVNKDLCFQNDVNRLRDGAVVVSS